MRRRKRYLPLAAALGAALAIMPTLAVAGTSAPSEVKLEVAQNCYLPDWPCWNPKGSSESNVSASEVAPFRIAQGGTLTFEDNDSKAPTDVVWKGSAPICTGVVQAPPTKTGWSGTCTFATAGEYEFESEGLWQGDGADYTKYKVMVESAGGGTTSTTGATGTTPTTTTTSTTPSASPESLLAGSLSQAVNVAKSQRGGSVKGTINLAKAAAGDRLEVDLLAQGASLAKAKHGARVRVGRYVRGSLSAGKLSFSVELSANARRAIKRHRRLALTVQIVLTPPGGEPLSITRSVVQHP